MSDIQDNELLEIAELRKTLSNNIRIFRKDLHLTQELLAESADISLSYLADIEHCKTWISDKTLLKLAKSLHKQPFELLATQNYDEKELDIQKISDVIFEEKKELIKSVSTICDKTLQKIMKLQ